MLLTACVAGAGGSGHSSGGLCPVPPPFPVLFSPGTRGLIPFFPVKCLPRATVRDQISPGPIVSTRQLRAIQGWICSSTFKPYPLLLCLCLWGTMIPPRGCISRMLDEAGHGGMPWNPGQVHAGGRMPLAFEKCLSMLWGQCELTQWIPPSQAPHLPFPHLWELPGLLWVPPARWWH